MPESSAGTRTRARHLAVAAAGLVVAGAALAVAARGARPHEIRLVARDMAFYVEGESDPNPTLRVRAGEEVRVVLTNEDAGMRHNLRLPSWRIETDLLDGKGRASVVFRAPAARGRHEYECAPHAAMMRGTIEVE